MEDKTVNEGSGRVGSVRTFLGALENIQENDESFLFFRGHSNFNYKIEPSIYRNSGWIENEDTIFKEMITLCPEDFDSYKSTFEMLVKMQHYSLPTRLLDITTNPLIALFFACSEGPSGSEDGEVVVFQIPKVNLKYFDSDIVSIISNISRRPITFKSSNEDIKFLIDEVRKEKPFFENSIKIDNIETVVCVKPKLNNARIVRQSGAFLLFGISKNKEKPAEIPSSYMANMQGKRIFIINNKKDKIRSQLAILGITEATVYPEIERVAGYLKDIYKLK